MSFLSDLFAIIEDRKANPKPGSYTNALFEQGERAILQKVGEESVEVLLAASHEGDERLVSELADLTYHCLVLLSARGLTIEDITAELERRHK